MRGIADALLRKPDGVELTLVAREGDEPLSGPQNAKWRSFTSLALPGGGAGPIFTTKLRPSAGGITTASDTDLYAVDSIGIVMR